MKTNDMMEGYAYWREYPERDTEYVRWYPCVVGPVSEKEVWKKKPLAFYIHIPFCNNVCHCCLYNKFNTKGSLVINYIEALKKEILNYASRHYIQENEFITGYLGGGTPTALTTAQLKDLLAFMFKHLNIKKDAHITIETTPLDIDEEKASMLLEQGVNRVSIGVQSFDDDLLRNIGRIHTGEKAKQVISMLRKTGYKEIGVDLMYGLPGQTLEKWKKTIDELIALKVESVSFYFYILIPSSPLFMKVKEGKVPSIPSQEVIDELYDYAINKLLSAGYVAASTNDFGSDSGIEDKKWEDIGVKVYPLGPEGYRGVMVPTFPRTVYLTHAWYNCGELLAVGSGAYGYIKDYTYINEPDIEKYIRRCNDSELPLSMGAYVSPEERMARNMVIGIKLLKILRSDFKDRYGVDFTQVFGRQIKELEEQGLVKLTDEALEVTYPKGWSYMDNISKAFYSDLNYRMPQPSPTNTNILKFLKRKEEK